MSVKPARHFPLLLLLFLAFQPRCPAQNTETPASLGPGAAQKRIVAEALKLVGRPDLVLPDKTFPWDCSGTVLAALYNAGLDVTREYGSYSGNGVRRLENIASHHELEYDLPLPELGDIIFWDNTYDKNGDLKWNDQLTHTGIVVGVNPDGTISYVHHDYRRGIVIAHMNLFYPESRSGIRPDGTKVEINSPMRMDSDRYLNPTQWLSSHLFRSFGRLHKLLNMPAPAIAGSNR